MKVSRTVAVLAGAIAVAALGALAAAILLQGQVHSLQGQVAQLSSQLSSATQKLNAASVTGDLITCSDLRQLAISGIDSNGDQVTVGYDNGGGANAVSVPGHCYKG